VNVRPLLESLAEAGGGEIDIVHLLPPFARRRLYCYPDLNQSDSRVNCHWTAMNFWSSQPDDRYLIADNIVDDLRKNYIPVTGQPRYGDLLMFMGERNPTRPSAQLALHFAIYIADNIVFTKNGSAGNVPWILEELDRLTECYLAICPSLQVKTMRLNAPAR
jgi:hypothetical protein